MTQTTLFKQTEVSRIRELEKKVEALDRLTTALKFLIELDRRGIKIQQPEGKYTEQVQSEFWK